MDTSLQRTHNETRRLAVFHMPPCPHWPYFALQDLTKMINANNEGNAASKAQQSGGHLTVVKAPVLAPADQKQKAKQAKAASGKT